MYLLILEREEGREREGEKHWCERETSIGCLSYAPRLRTKPTIKACTPHRACAPQPFSLWDDAPTSWATLARAKLFLCRIFWPSHFDAIVATLRSFHLTLPCPRVLQTRHLHSYNTLPLSPSYKRKHNGRSLNQDKSKVSCNQLAILS